MKKVLSYFAFLLMLTAAGCSHLDEPGTEDGGVVRFGLRSGDQGKEVLTKTSYSGDLVDLDGDLKEDSERINWLAGDRIKVVSNLAATTPGGDAALRSSVFEIDGATIKVGTTKQISEAEIVPASGYKDLYWNTSPSEHYFYSVYPAPAGTPENPSISAVSDSKTVQIGAVIPSAQNYESKTGTTVIELKPVMSYAYMYAGTKKASGNTTNVDLAFKPLFTAYTFRISALALDDEAKKLKIKKVTLKSSTDDLSGNYTATIGVNGSGESVINSVGTSGTTKEVSLSIAGSDQFVLGEKTLVVTLFTLPVDQTNLTLELTLERNGVDVKRSLALNKAGSPIVVRACHKQILKFGMPDIDYEFHVESLHTNLPRTWRSSGNYTVTDFFTVKSYKTKTGSPAGGVAWSVTGYKDGGSSSFSATAPAWLFLEQEDGTGTESFDITALSKQGNRLRDWNDPVSHSYVDSDGNYVDASGVAYAYDLSSHDIYGNLYAGKKNGDLVETANCYVVSAPGWYRLPLVYGNGFKNGTVNSAAYTGPDTGNNLMLKGFLNHANRSITSPWLKDNAATPNGAALVWEDAVGLISQDAAMSPRVEGDYLYFYVDAIAQGNAVIAAKIGNTVVWSWQIWAVDNPAGTLEVINVERNLKRKIKGDNTKYDNPYLSVYQAAPMFKMMNLGQNGSETVNVAERSCQIEFTQGISGIKHVVTVTQSGVNDTQGATPFYQWGRKDPMRSDINPPVGAGTGSSIGTSIQNPQVFYIGNSSESWHGGATPRYDNLWNTNVTAAVTNWNVYSASNTGGRRDQAVCKTIYDPCPPGFKMPNMYAFNAFNPYGIENTPVSSGYDWAVRNVTYSSETSWTAGRYYDFYTAYDESQALLREKNPSKIIRMYALGRRNGNNPNGLITDNNIGYYWTAAPAAWGGAWSHGTCLYFMEPLIGGTKIYPVYGTSTKPGFQRTHGFPVRPMRDI